MKDEKLDFNLHPSEFGKYWSLDREITFLNHGSFGACPIPVLEAQERLRLQMESEPLRFFVREFEELLDRARRELAEFVGADAGELAFVPNATTGVNAVLRSLTFDPGDELLTTDHEYNACRNVLNFVAERTGAKVVVAEIPFPLGKPEQIIRAVCDRVTAKTKLALLDHITSQTGLILPIREITQALTMRGVDTLIDGAHAHFCTCDRTSNREFVR
jgi:isopenicillin-N epimerase